MGKLEELEEELYGRDEEPLEKRTKRSSLIWGRSSSLPTRWKEKGLKTSLAEKASSRLIFSFFWAALIFIFMVGGAIFIFFYLSTRGQEAVMAIYGQDRIEAGEIVTIPVVFRNTSRTALREVELAVVLPEGSLVRENNIETKAPARIIKKFSDLVPGKEEVTEIKIRIFGREGEEKTIQSTLLYRPENLRARFSVRAEKSILISRVPLATSFEMPDTLARGQEVEFKVNFISSASIPFDNMYVRLEYPPGFTFKKAEPQPQIDDDIWRVGTVRPGGNGLISVRGVISGDDGEIKSFRAGIGVFDESTRAWNVYSEASGETKIAVTPLLVQGFLDKKRERIINPGETLSITLRYKNNTAFTLRNVSVKSSLGMGPYPDAGKGFLEFETLVIDKGGVFDEPSRSLVWGPSNTEELLELKPGQEGEVGFSIHTKERPPVRRAEDRNLFVSLRSNIEAAGIPPELEGAHLFYEDTVELKLRSKILFSSRALFRSSPLVNSGPLPPQIGAKTTYAVLWEIRNFTSDLKDVEVKTALPPNIRWENLISPQGAGITFNQASGEVRWRVGDVKAGTGILTPALLGAFQISIVPAEVDFGKAVNLTNKSQLLALDVFTNEKRVEEGLSLTTELREDPAASTNDWRVVR